MHFFNLTRILYVYTNKYIEEHLIPILDIQRTIKPYVYTILKHKSVMTYLIPRISTSELLLSVLPVLLLIITT